MSATPISLAVQRLTAAARLPTKGHASDLGWDLYAAAPLRLEPGQLGRISTGIAVGFPAGIGGIVKDRSSLAVRGLHTLAGVIDPDYRGEIMVVCVNLGTAPIEIATGDRCAQLLLLATVRAETVEAADLQATARGDGGFGSTGR